jgi:hypothetical protein
MATRRCRNTSNDLIHGGRLLLLLILLLLLLWIYFYCTRRVETHTGKTVRTIIRTFTHASICELNFKLPACRPNSDKFPAPHGKKSKSVLKQTQTKRINTTIIVYSIRNALRNGLPSASNIREPIKKDDGYKSPKTHLGNVHSVMSSSQKVNSSTYMRSCD